MPWFIRSKSAASKLAKEEIWVKCRGCGAHVFKEEYLRNLNVCPKCNFHERIGWKQRLNLLIDEGTFQELNAGIEPADPLQFVDGKGSYAEKTRETIAKTGLHEAIVTGHGRLLGIHTDFKFLGGSLGSATGEKILQAANYAYENRIPLIILSASGGARMHEGILSLMQMAKTCAGIARLRERRIPYISVLTDPTTGGVSASYAMMGDLNIAEPRALIGFAGRRVIEQTIRQKLPDDFQTAEYLVAHGFVDRIVNRKDMKAELGRILSYFRLKE